MVVIEIDYINYAGNVKKLEDQLSYYTSENQAINYEK